jgi:hypothetical protein
MNVQHLFERCGIATTLVAAVLLIAATPAVAPDTNRYGGPVYAGDPALVVTSSLYAAGGGAGSFSTVRALTSIVGDDTLQSELVKLRGQYGAQAVDQFVRVSDFAINDAWKIAGADNVKIPTAGTLTGKDLGSALVQAGTDTSNTFWTGLLLDKALTHKVNMQVMTDIDTKYGEPVDASYHKIANQLFYDFAQSMGTTNLKLADDH